MMLDKRKCKATTKKGKICSNYVKNSDFCRVHSKNLVDTSQPEVSECGICNLPFEILSNILERTSDGGYGIIPILCRVNKFFSHTVTYYVKSIWFQELYFLPNISRSGKITDGVIKSLSHCVSAIDLSCTLDVTDDSVRTLTKLKDLRLHYNYTVTNNGISALTNLVSLNLCHNGTITDNGITDLTKLTYLNILSNSNITDISLSKLTNLKILKYSPIYNDEYASYVTDESISKLTSLTSLEIHNALYITDASISLLTSLNSLQISHNDSVTHKSINLLTNLKKLTMMNTGIFYHNLRLNSDVHIEYMY